MPGRPTLESSKNALRTTRQNDGRSRAESIHSGMGVSTGRLDIWIFVGFSRRGVSPSAPEDAGGVGVDFAEKVSDPGARVDHVVVVPAAVAV